MKSRKIMKPSKETQKILDSEIRKQVHGIAEHIATAFDAECLWALHREYGWGKVRLRRFYVRFAKALNEIEKYYETNIITDGHYDADYYICEELKRIGVDLPLWREQKDNWNLNNDKCWQNYKAGGRK